MTSLLWSSETLSLELQPQSTPTAVLVKDELEPKPFWRTKEKVLKNMHEERQIVCSASVDKFESISLEEKEKRKLLVVAAGIVNVPMEWGWKTVRQFEKLPKVDDRFQEVKYYPERERLFLHLVAYGYHAKMIMQLRFGESSRAREIHFEVVEGMYLGMSGVIRLEDVGRQKTEISLTSQYISASIPLPAILMGVGLEIVGGRVASSMRSYLESEFKPEFKSEFKQTSPQVTK